MDMPKKIMVEGRVLDLVVESAVLHRIAPLTESEGDVEKEPGKWVADVWRLGEENLNGRIYTEELADRLIKENPTTPAYDGHFCDWVNGNEYQNAKAVCKNLRKEDGIMKCDIEFLECEKAYEEKLTELYQKGVAIGVSSVGYGEYEADGKTIKPDTYTLVRVLDFVTQPAGEVYATIASEKVEKKDAPVVMTTEAMAERKSVIADFVKNLIK